MPRSITIALLDCALDSTSIVVEYSDVDGEALIDASGDVNISLVRGGWIYVPKDNIAFVSVDPEPESEEVDDV
jgi:hypothetical protein